MSYYQTLYGSGPKAANILEIIKIHTTHAYLKQSRWLVFTVRVACNEHNIMGAFVEHNRKIFDTAIHWQVEDRLCLSVELHVVLGRFPTLYEFVFQMW